MVIKSMTNAITAICLVCSKRGLECYEKVLASKLANFQYQNCYNFHIIIERYETFRKSLFSIE